MKIQSLLPGYTKNLINDELAKGACFDKLNFPIKALNKFNIIQFRSSNPLETAGLGASKNLKDAYIIAYFEYLERKAFFDLGINLGFDSTNGIALHKFKFLAINAAKSEAFERDSFLLHWYSNTPFLCIEENIYLKNLKSAIDELLEIGFYTKIGRTFLGEQETIVVTLIDSKSGGFALGLSSGRGTEKDIEKAFLEACINLFFGDCGRTKAQLLEQISQEGVNSLAGHRAFWLYLNQLPAWFYRKIEIDLQDAIQKNYKKGNYNLKPLMITDIPFPVVGIQSVDLLKLEVGMPSVQTINLLRRRFNTNIFQDNDLWKQPHPIP